MAGAIVYFGDSVIERLNGVQSRAAMPAPFTQAIGGRG